MRHIVSYLLSAKVGKVSWFTHGDETVHASQYLPQGKGLRSGYARSIDPEVRKAVFGKKAAAILGFGSDTVSRRIREKLLIVS
jgi:hypothetical protein